MTGTHVRSVDWRSITLRISTTWAADALVVVLALKTCLIRWTFAEVRSNSIFTSSAILARITDAVVDVDVTRRTSPTIHTDAHERSIAIETRAAVRTRRMALLTLVHIISAIVTEKAEENAEEEEDTT